MQKGNIRVRVEEFYDKYIRDRKEEFKNLEKEKVKDEKMIMKSFFIFFLVIPILIGYIGNITNINHITIYLFMLSFMIPFFIIFSKSKKKNDIVLLKEKIFEKFFQECFEEDFKYSYNGQFSKDEIKKITGILPPFYNDKVYSNDTFELEVKGKNIKMGDIIYYDEKRDYCINALGLKKMKKGPVSRQDVLLKIEINNKDNLLLVVEPKKVYDKSINVVQNLTDTIQNFQSQSSKYKISSSYYEEFNSKFNMYNYSKIELEKKEEIIKLLIDIYNKYEINYRMLIKENYLYVILENIQIVNEDFFAFMNFDEKEINYFLNLKKQFENIKRICESFETLEEKIN